MNKKNKPNRSRLYATLARIKSNPSSWRQISWHTVEDCGTAHCFAGHGQIEAGWYDVTTDKSAMRKSDPRGTQGAARAYYNLNSYQAIMLFDAANTIDDIEGAIKLLVGDAEDFRPSHDPYDVYCRDDPRFDRHDLLNDGYDGDGLDINNLPRSKRRKYHAK